MRSYGDRASGKQPLQKISDEQIPEIVERYKCGENISDLAHAFNVSNQTILRKLRNAEATRSDVTPPRIKDKSLRAFASKVRSVLWNRDPGPDGDREHPTYWDWKGKVSEYREKLNCPYGVAIVRASKDFPFLWRLFSRYDIAEFDPHPDSHPMIKHYKKPEKSEKKEIAVKNENIEQTHRENLNWAVAAAGEYHRTGISPTSCPNDAAYYFYMQAISDPKDMLSRLTQTELKAGDEHGTARQSGQRSIDELDEMLTTLEEGEE